MELLNRIPLIASARVTPFSVDADEAAHHHYMLLREQRNCGGELGIPFDRTMDGLRCGDGR